MAEQLDTITKELKGLQIQSPNISETAAATTPDILSTSIITLSNPPFSTFHHFPLLPSEIRIKIWSVSLTPRLFNLVYTAHGLVRGPSTRWQYHSGALSSNAPAPSILHTCFESREISLQYYYPVMRHRYPNVHAPKYFNPSIDTLAIEAIGVTSSSLDLSIPFSLGCYFWDLEGTMSELFEEIKYVEILGLKWDDQHKREPVGRRTPGGVISRQTKWIRENTLPFLFPKLKELTLRTDENVVLGRERLADCGETLMRVFRDWAEEFEGYEVPELVLCDCEQGLDPHSHSVSTTVKFTLSQRMEQT